MSDIVDDILRKVRAVMRQDDACNYVVPSDLRVLVGEIDRLRSSPSLPDGWVAHSIIRLLEAIDDEQPLFVAGKDTQVMADARNAAGTLYARLSAVPSPSSNEDEREGT